MPTVKLPDGTTAQFPDGMAPKDIQSAIETHLASLNRPAGLPAGVDLPGFAAHPAVSMPDAGKGPIGSFADSSGLSTLGHAIAHPGNTVKNVVQALNPNNIGEDSADSNPLLQGLAGMVSNTTGNIKQGIADFKKSGLSQETRRDFGRAVPIVGPVLAHSQEQYDAGNPLGAAGTIAGTVAGAVAPKALGNLGKAIGPAMQDSGVGRINSVVGSLKSDFARGANPGEGYFQAKLGPSLSMGSIADKATAANEGFGEQIGDAIDNSPLSRIGMKIPVQDAAQAIGEPLNKAHAVLSGPGSLAGSATPIEELSASFRPALQQAAQNGGFTPRQLFDLKKNVSANTAWSDPLQIGIKQARQQIVGGLGETLSDNLPELGDLNSAYRNTLKLADRATDRAITNRPSLSGVGNNLVKTGAVIAGAAKAGIPGAALGAIPAVINSVPLQTSIASGLYYGGSAASRLSPFARFLPPPSILGVPDDKVPKK